MSKPHKPCVVTIRTDNDGWRLFQAAPEICRALLAVEWGGLTNYGTAEACPYCGGESRRHEEGCIVDAALTEAGLPDQASRDAARKELGL